MIVYASPRTQGTDTEGNTQPIAVVGSTPDELKVADMESRDYLQEIINELMIMNTHSYALTDLGIDREEMMEVG